MEKSETKQVAHEIELDIKTLLMPLSIIISAVIISVPISVSLYLGLSNSGLRGGVAGVVQAAECDPASRLSKDCLVSYANEVGLDLTKFTQCLDAKTFDADVASQIDYGNEIGVSGTPSIFIGENQGNKMRGFEVGAGISSSEATEIVSRIESDGIGAAAEYWKEQQLGDLSRYETQLRDYYTQQGQSGDTLSNSVQQGLDQRRQEVNSQVTIRDYEYGKGNLLGNSGAKTALMEFSDYECPFCQRFAQGALADMKVDLIDSGRMLLVFMDFPLESIHPNARRAAYAARCAGDQGKYFDYHDRLFGLTE